MVTETLGKGVEAQRGHSGEEEGLSQEEESGHGAEVGAEEASEAPSASEMSLRCAISSCKANVIR